REQLCVPGPADGYVELLRRGVAELGQQAFQEERLGDALIVVLLQGLVDPADGRMTQDAAGDDLLAGRDASVRERLPERCTDAVSGLHTGETEDLRRLDHREEVVQLEVQL